MSLTLHPTDHVRTAGLRRADTLTARRAWPRARTDIVVEPPLVEFTWANRRPGTVGFARWAAQLGQRIDERGLAGTADDVDKLVGSARQLGAAVVATDVLADPTQPEPARLRAFAHVVSTLVAISPPVNSGSR